MGVSVGKTVSLGLERQCLSVCAFRDVYVLLWDHKEVGGQLEDDIWVRSQRMSSSFLRQTTVSPGRWCFQLGKEFEVVGGQGKWNREWKYMGEG